MKEESNQGCRQAGGEDRPMAREATGDQTGRAALLADSECADTSNNLAVPDKLKKQYPGSQKTLWFNSRVVSRADTPGTPSVLRPVLFNARQLSTSSFGLAHLVAHGKESRCYGQSAWPGV